MANDPAPGRVFSIGIHQYDKPADAIIQHDGIVTGTMFSSNNRENYSASKCIMGRNAPVLRPVLPDYEITRVAEPTGKHRFDPRIFEYLSAFEQSVRIRAIHATASQVRTQSRAPVQVPT